MTTERHFLRSAGVHEWLAGFSALAFQIVTFKLILMTGLGDSLSVAVSLTAFVCLSGIGALFGGYGRGNHRLSVEISLGLYGLMLFGFVQMQGADSVILLLGRYSLELKLVFALALLAPLALLSGALLPLYERTRCELPLSGSGHKRDAFTVVFIAFHAGGAAALIALEVFVFPVMGWIVAGLILGATSVVNGLLGRRQAVDTLDPVRTTPAESSFCPKYYVLLFLLSVCTGVAGLIVYKVFDYLVGPNIRNYTIVTAFIFAGLAIAGVLVRRFIRSMSDIVFMTVLGIAWLTGIGVTLPHLLPLLIHVSDNIWVIYSLVAILLIVPMFAFLGASIPGAVKLGAQSHFTLFLVSLGNAVGYWLYIAFSDLNLDLIFLVLVIIALSVAIFRLKPLMTVAVVILGITGPMLSSQTAIHQSVLAQMALMRANLFQGRMLSLGMSAVDRPYDTVDFLGAWNSYGWSADHIAVYTDRDSPPVYTSDYLYIGGMRSLKIFSDRPYSDSYNLQVGESVSALLPAFFANDDNRALVLGAGTGVSAAAIDSFFGNTEIVDISPDALEHLVHFSELNDRIYDRALLHEKDALTLLTEKQNQGQHYDYIFNTLTGPGYSFSAWMYSRESMRMIRDSLEPGGIYAFWLDPRTGDDGARLLINAVHDVFGHTRVFKIGSDTIVNPSFGGDGDHEWEPGYQVILSSTAPLTLNEKTGGQLMDTLGQIGIRSADSRTTEDSIQQFLGSRFITTPLSPEASLAGADMARMAYAYNYKLELSRIVELIGYSEAAAR